MSESGTSHPKIAAIGKVLAGLEGTRHARAKQFLTACVVRGIDLGDPAALEEQVEGCVVLLRDRETA